jgi:hypothetical protein
MSTNLPFPIRPAPDPLADDMTRLLQGPLADAWGEAGPPARLRGRLAQRAAASAGDIGRMVTVRRHHRLETEGGSGVTVHELYRCAAPSTARPGEPHRVRLAHLAPGAAWMPTAPKGESGRDWLLTQGRATLQIEGRAALSLSALDYHVEAGGPAPACLSAGPQGAVVLLREGAPRRDAATSREMASAWEVYAPLIRRRVLWHGGDQATLLYLAEAGACVPQHRHGLDEECLMLRGDLYLDDCLLQEGDYQLAPGGTQHDLISTDTGALIYAHGDLEMRFTGA